MAPSGYRWSMSRPPNTSVRRAQIAHAMVRLLARHGLAGATMRALSTETGLTQGLLHYHFPSKQEMVGAALEELEGRLRERVTTAEARGGEPLDALVDALSPEAPVDMLGHSLGGNVVMSYAGVRPQRIRRLVNLEGFGLPDADPQQAPQRLTDWLDELKTPQRLKPYASRAQVAQRLRANNPRLAADHALWLADHWAQPDADGQWHLQADAAHKRINPVPYRAADVVATWSRISAPLLWVQGDSSTPERHWQGRYSVAEFHQRLDQVPHVRREVLREAGHMLHHDQPQALAALLADFLA